MPKFQKTERLCSRKLIDDLFQKGTALNGGIIRLLWMPLMEDNKPSAKILTVVPKKKIKLAVNRNLIKRRIREAYRNNKNIIYPVLLDKKLNIAVAINYSASDIHAYGEIEHKIILTLNLLKTAIEKAH